MLFLRPWYNCLFIWPGCNGKEHFYDWYFCVHQPDWVLWVLCLISMLHLMMLFLRLQCGSLLMWWEWKRVNCWWMSFVCLRSFVFTPQIEFSECCVWFQCFTQWFCSCVSNVVVCWWFYENWKEVIVDGCLLRVFFLLSSPLRSRFVSVVFCFNTSLMYCAPESLRSLPVI